MKPPIHAISFLEKRLRELRFFVEKEQKLQCQYVQLREEFLASLEAAEKREQGWRAQILEIENEIRSLLAASKKEEEQENNGN